MSPASSQNCYSELCIIEIWRETEVRCTPNRTGALSMGTPSDDTSQRSGSQTVLLTPETNDLGRDGLCLRGCRVCRKNSHVESWRQEWVKPSKNMTLCDLARILIFALGCHSMAYAYDCESTGGRTLRINAESSTFTKRAPANWQEVNIGVLTWWR